MGDERERARNGYRVREGDGGLEGGEILGYMARGKFSLEFV